MILLLFISLYITVTVSTTSKYIKLQNISQNFFISVRLFPRALPSSISRVENHLNKTIKSNNKEEKRNYEVSVNDVIEELQIVRVSIFFREMQ